MTSQSSYQNLQHMSAQDLAGELEVSYAHGQHKVFNEIMSELQADPQLLSKVAQQIKPLEGFAEDQLGVQSKIEYGKDGSVTAIEFTKHKSGGGGLWGDICGAADSVANFASSAANDTVKAVETAGKVGVDLAKGAVNEVIDHPLTILKDVGEGALIGGVTALTGGVGLAVLAGGYISYELATKGLKGTVDSVVRDADGAVHLVTGFAHDTTVLYDSGNYSKAEVAAANQGLEQDGGVGAQFAAFGVGGVAGAAGADALATAFSGSGEAAGTSALTQTGVVEDGEHLPASAVSASPDDSIGATAASSSTGSDLSGGAALQEPEIGNGIGTVNADGVRVMSSTDQTAQLYDSAQDANGELQFAKPDLQPADAKYYQVEAHQISLSDYPDGLRVSTSEAPLQTDSDITLANGDTIPEGKLPVGVQVSGDTIHTPPNGVTLANGTVLNDGITLPAGTDLTGGQQLNDGNWLITRTTTVDGQPGYDVYTPDDGNFQERWRPVDGQPGQYSPKSVPTNMVYMPSGKFEIPTAWGTASGDGPAFLAKYGPGDYNIITLKDATETGYLDNPTTPESQAFVAQMVKGQSAA